MFYVLQVYNNSELAVKQQIENKIKEGLLPEIKEVLVPYQKVISISEKGKRTELKKAVYPGYIYLDIEPYTHQTYQQLKKIPKVSKFIGEKNHPTPMSPQEIEKIRKTDYEAKTNDKPVYRIKFDIGSKVEILNGPFIGCKGEITHHDPENKKVEVDINILGRITKLSLNENDINVI